MNKWLIALLLFVLSMSKLGGEAYAETVLSSVESSFLQHFEKSSPWDDACLEAPVQGVTFQWQRLQPDFDFENWLIRPHGLSGDLFIEARESRSFYSSKPVAEAFAGPSHSYPYNSFW